MTIVKSAVIKAAGSAVLLVAIAGGIARAQDDVERGRLLVTSLCGECHAVGRTGTSPHVGAPTFRSLDDRVDLDEFAGRLRAGLESGHADMPSFRFSRKDVRVAIAYLRSIQGP